MSVIPYRPKPYQERAQQFVLENPYCALWMDMGLGKTVVTLTAVDALLRLDRGPVLVIAPLRVADVTWPAELRKWSHLRHLCIRQIRGDPAVRLRAATLDADIYITNRENTAWMVDNFGKRWRWPVIVLDESSSFKNPGARRFRALRHLRHYDKYQRMVQLTGTPSPNGLMDIWTQLFLLDGGERLGPTVTEYRRRYFEQEPATYSYRIKPFAQQVIQHKIRDRVLSLSAQDYLELPERIESISWITLPPNARRAYHRLREDFMLRFGNGQLITVANAGVMINKALQIANGAIYHEDGRYTLLHEEKLEALGEILDTHDGPVLVGYSYVSDRERIQRRWPYARDLRNNTVATVEAWNRGEIPLLIAHPASCGHGLNLQTGGHLIVWFGLPWSLELFLQFNARLHRLGQEKPVFIHYLLARNTADERVYRNLVEKDTAQLSLLEAVRAQFMEQAA